MLKDIVYILRPGPCTEELKYSLRSVEANFPHRKVWFVCGKPDGLEPDGWIKHSQCGDSKWALIRSSMYEAIKCPDITDDFYLFNDDFFVMRPFKGEFINYVDGTLTERIEQFRLEFPWLSPYARTLQKAREELKCLGKGELNFDVHLPMLFNKELAARSINTCSSPQMRSVYGNYNAVPFVEHKDVKVHDFISVPSDPDFLSTNDESFTKGAVGSYIRGCFSEPSRFEITRTQTG